MRKDGENRLVGIGDNWIFDVFLGLGLAVAFYVLGKIFGIVGAIAVPTLPQAINVGEVGEFIVLVVGASIFESILFQDLVLDFFDKKYMNFPFIMAVILSSLAFSVFHYYAYAINLNLGFASFMSAFFVGFLLCYIRKWRGSLAPVIAFHGMLNFIIIFIVGKHWIVLG